MRSWLSRLIQTPEFNVGIFSFMLNFIWEVWQIPFYRDMPLGFHWDGVVICTQATFGDVVIALLAFWAVVAIARSREWILQPTFLQSTTFVAVGVAITVVMEALATGPLERWAYADSMPVVPVLGTGLFPLLQWIVLPPLVIWFVRRQLT